MSTEIKRAVCPYDCPTTCGFFVETDGNKIIKTIPDKNHPASQGILCRKMRKYEDSVNSDKRILKPLIRTGKKSGGEFREASWDEAVKLISGRWKEIIDENGPEAIAYCNYSGVMSDIQRNCGEAFFNYMGACSLVKTLCSTAKGVGYSNVVGKTSSLDPREIKDSDLYIIWGSNMMATSIQSMPDIINAKRDGKKIILVEPYAESMKQYCDEIILIKPGTDGALALAMMNVLVKHGFADEEFLRENADGYEEFKETLSEYSPEWAEGITGIPAKTIENFAAEYGRAKAPAIILGSGNSRYGNGAMTVRLITILSLFTGVWMNKGGGICGCAPIDTSYVNLKLINRTDFRQKPAKRININQLGTAIKDKEIKSLYVYGGNPANSVSNIKAVLEGLEREDIFTVVHERFMTDTAKYADVILPATFSVEQTDIYRSYGYCTLQTARKAVEPPGECKSNWDTFCLLAKEMGYEDEYFTRTEDEMFEFVLNNPTKAVEKLSYRERQELFNGGSVNMPFSDHTVWKTDSGKIKIVNEKLAESMPRYIESHGGEYPIKLISVPDVHTLNTVFTNNPNLSNKRGTMRLAIHSKDAEARGIKNKDRIICFNDLAEVEFEAFVTENIAKGTAAAVGTFRSEQTLNGLGVNALHHDRLSDMGEATTMNDNTVDIRLA
ncbi:MAG: molybdopterin-dependent oxidoreductase [Clostridiales bacterium]|nr:molybdopterin-dependent oxidoreductase [Clostridiales bacterium]